MLDTLNYSTMDLQNLVQFMIVSGNEETAVANGNTVNDINLVTEFCLDKEFDEAYINVVEDIGNSTPQDNNEKLNVITETLYPKSSSSDKKDFITLHAAAAQNTASNPDSPQTVTENDGGLSTVIPPVSPSEVCAVSSKSNLSSDDHMLNTVSPADVFVECKRRRGRRPKSMAGVQFPPAKPKKIKAYEIDTPFEDKKMERRRLNAINAKRHREFHRQEKEKLQQQLDEAISERDSLRKQVFELRKREEKLLRQVEMFKNRARSLMSIFKDGE